MDPPSPCLPAFPFFVLAMVPYRLLLKFIFTEQELDAVCMYIKYMLNLSCSTYCTECTYICAPFKKSILDVALELVLFVSILHWYLLSLFFFIAPWTGPVLHSCLFGS
jgi:hypothetical protein